MLKAVNISKKFGGNIVLENFSRDFPDGKTAVILGRSGCGKTTLLNILMGLLPPDGGEVLRDGQGANIRLVTGGTVADEQIVRELSAVGLPDCMKKPVRELSGGMKRRVALLRALLSKYDILFADEPFKGLDLDTKQSVLQYFKEKTLGKTVVLVTHDSAECELLADEVIRL